MKAITLRDIPPELARIIRAKAEAEGTSFSKTILKMLHEQAGTLPARGEPTAHHDLDALAGGWTQEDWEQFERALADQRRIDPEIWE